MSVDAGLPSSASVGDARGSAVTKQRREAVLLAPLCLVELAWIAAVFYGVFHAQDYVRGLF